MKESKEAKMAREKMFNYFQGTDAKDKRNYEHELFRDQLFDQIKKYDLLDLGIQTKREGRFSFKQKILLAAGLALVIGVSLVYNSKYSGNLNDQVFASYYHTYQIENKLTSRVPSNNDFNFNVAFQLYNQGNYQDAINQFEGIFKNDTTRITACFLLGMSYIEVQNYPKAIKHLSYVIDQNSAIGKQAEWYLALCCVKTGQKAQANLLLNRIIGRNNCFKPLALEILRKIDN